MTCTFWLSAREYPKVDGHQCGAVTVATVGTTLAVCRAHADLLHHATTPEQRERIRFFEVSE